MPVQSRVLGAPLCSRRRSLPVAKSEVRPVAVTVVVAVLVVALLIGTLVLRRAFITRLRSRHWANTAASMPSLNDDGTASSSRPLDARDWVTIHIFRGKLQDMHKSAVLQEPLLQVLRQQEQLQHALDQGFVAVQMNFEQVHTGLSTVSEMLAVLVMGEHDCPALVWVSPKDAVDGLWGKLDKWVPSNWFSETMVVHFVCPYTMAVVGCGPRGNGYEIRRARAWVTKHAKLISVGMFVVNLALTAGRIVGVPLPQLSLADAVPAAAADVAATAQRQLVALKGLAESLDCELPSEPDCQELYTSAREDAGEWNKSGLAQVKVQEVNKAKLPVKLQGADLGSFRAWLEEEHPRWRETAGVEKAVHPATGRVEWVSTANVGKWKATHFDDPGQRTMKSVQSQVEGKAGGGGPKRSCSVTKVGTLHEAAEADELAQDAAQGAGASVPSDGARATTSVDQRSVFSTEQSTDLRSARPTALVGRTIEVGGETGIVTGLLKKRGGATLHKVAFTGGRVENIHLAKCVGGKGVAFHVL